MPQPPALPPGYDPFLAEASQSIEVHCWTYAKPWEIKTIPLSTHVNPAYALEDLEQHALMPFEVGEDKEDERDNVFAGRKPRGGFFTAPYLETRRRMGKERVMGNPKFNDLDLGDHPVEEPGPRKCCLCKKRWGRRSEELGRNFQLKVLSGLGLGHLRRKVRRRVCGTLTSVSEMLS